MLHPATPKAVLPNPKPRAWDLSLSERTSNMLKNLERSRWVTSYQMHHTGEGAQTYLTISAVQELLDWRVGLNLIISLRDRTTVPYTIRSFGTHESFAFGHDRLKLNRNQALLSPQNVHRSLQHKKNTIFFFFNLSPTQYVLLDPA